MQGNKIIRNIQQIVFSLLFVISISYAKTWHEKNFDMLTATVGLPHEQAQNLSLLLDKNDQAVIPIVQGTCDLITQFPKISSTISYIQFAELPTPVQDAYSLADWFDIESLHIKRDDLTAAYDQQELLFGGNKIRKLEFLLADAVAHNVDTMMTFGAAGSNHATATAEQAKKLGMGALLILLPQKNSYTVQRNLLLNLKNNAQLVLTHNKNLRMASAVHHFFHHKQEHNSYPYVITSGGSSPLGVLGYVNAALELKKQIEQGILPEPDYIYLPIGSGGTVSGLLLGCKAAGIKTKIIAVSVEPNKDEIFAKKVQELFTQTNELLHAADPSFPICSYSEQDLIIRSDFAGVCYGVFTKEGMAAKKMFEHALGVILDGVYSAKAAAALLYDAQQDLLQDKKVLFWHTFCSDDFAQELENISYTNLPKAFHNYFERPTQEQEFNC